MSLVNRNKNQELSWIKYILQPKPLLDFFRAFIYIAFAVLLFFTPGFLETLPIYKYIFCGGALLYGLFRVLRIRKNYLKMQR